MSNPYEIRNYIMEMVRSRSINFADFNFESLTCPPIISLFTPQDIDSLREIATSLKYAGRPKIKFQKIDKIMQSRGFVKLSGGTNRLCYRHIENKSFVVKVAYDITGMQDNPAEFANQHSLKPFCTKIFEVAGDGVIATSERVEPLINKEQMSYELYDILTLLESLSQRFVFDDLNAKSFMNFGYRDGFGVVILDYPYTFRFDSRKMYCNSPDATSISGCCDGQIVYTLDYTKLQCKKCGRIYQARSLAKDIEKQNIIIREKETKKMKITLTGGTHNLNKVVETQASAESMPTKPISTTQKKISVSAGKQNNDYNVIKPTSIKVTTNKPNRNVEEKKEEPAKKVEEPVVKREEHKEAPVANRTNAAPVSPINFINMPKDAFTAYTSAIAEARKIVYLCDSDARFDAKEKIEIKTAACNFAIDMIVKLYDSMIKTNTEYKQKLIDALFTNGDFSVCMNTEDGYVEALINDDEQPYYTEPSKLDISEFMYTDTMYTEEPVEEESVPVEEETSVTNETEELVGYIDAEYLAAQIINIKDLIPGKEDKEAMILINIDGDPITIEDGIVLAIDKIDNRDLSEVELTSKSYIEGLIQENKDLTEALDNFTNIPETTEEVTEEAAEETPIEVYDIPVEEESSSEEIAEEDEIKEEGE